MPIDEDNDQDQAVPRKRGGLAWRVALIVIVLVAIGGFAGATYEANRTNAEGARAKPATIATAIARGVPLYDRPGGTRPWAVIRSPNRQGAKRTFLVQEKRTGWLRVLLPLRPNGSTAWIPPRTTGSTCR